MKKKSLTHQNYFLVVREDHSVGERNDALLHCFIGNNTSPQYSDSTVCEDECFTHVINNDVQRGCLSSVTDLSLGGVDIVKDCMFGEICKKCSNFNLCNNQTIDPEYCISCDSHFDSVCVIGSQIYRKKCPLSVSPFGCFLAVDEGNSVKRGCMSDLSGEERKGYRENSKAKVCFGFDCNLKPSFQKCYACNSSADGERCIYSPSQTNQITCDDYLGSCYTHIENGVVNRGCIGDTSIPSADDCTDPTTCQVCSNGDGCNNEVFKSEKCFSCHSDVDPQCRTNPLYAANRLCPVSTTQMGCYHIENSTTVVRGCVNQLSQHEFEDCVKNPEQCKICQLSNCNLRETFQKCFVCSSLVSSNCMANHGNIETKVCTSYDDECFSYAKGSSVRRGCLKEMKNEFIVECRNTPEKCETCSRPNNSNICNNRDLSGDTCIECDSNHDLNCLDDKELIKSETICSLGVNKTAGCYLQVVRGKRHKRGCVSDLIPLPAREMCINQTEDCKSCIGKNCNEKLSYQRCHVCNGRHNPGCAETPDESNSTICPDYISSCLTGTDRLGYTHRRCSTSATLDKDEFLDQFQICSDVNCNKYHFPRYRLLCYQCNGVEDCEFVKTNSSSTIQPKPCGIFSEYDQCYTYVENGT